MNEEKREWDASAQSEEKPSSKLPNESDNEQQQELPGLQPDLPGSLALLAKAIERQTTENAKTNDLIVDMLAQTAAFIQLIADQLEDEEDEDLGLYLDNTPAPPRRRGA